MKVYNVQAPSRFGSARPAGAAGTIGKPSWRPLAGPGGVGGPIGDAWASFLSSATSAAQVALGAGLLLVAVGIVISQTSAGRAAGGAARTGARLTPVGRALG